MKKTAMKKPPIAPSQSNMYSVTAVKGDALLVIDYLLAAYMTRFTRKLLADSPKKKHTKTVHPGDTRMLYIHIPFCRELCKFCTFNRIIFDRETADLYFDRLSNELRMYREKGYRFTTLYVGGGTPTILPERLCEILALAKNLWEIGEISVETNPADLAPEVTTQLKTAGVNRLSVGIQSFEDSLLTSENRRGAYGSLDDLEHRLTELSETFDTLNVDLIYGLSGQSKEQVLADIDTIKRLRIDQVTCYPLMKDEQRIPSYWKWAPEGAWSKDVYFAIRRALKPEYSSSSAWCFSRNPGMIDEYIVGFPSYAGAGSGAFGLVGNTLAANDFSVPGYTRTAGTGSPVRFSREFSVGESLRYHLLMQLFGGRLDLASIRQGKGLRVTTSLGLIHILLRVSGAVRKDNDRTVVTVKGAYWTVLLMKYFFQGVSRLRTLCRDISGVDSAGSDARGPIALSKVDQSHNGE